MATLQKSKKSTCGTLQCPGAKAENEMSGVKALVEKVLVEMGSLKETLAGTMERTGLIHQVRELSDSQRATAHAVEKLTEALQPIYLTWKASQYQNAATNLKIDGVVYDQRVSGEHLVTAGDHIIGPVSSTNATPYISGLRTP